MNYGRRSTDRPQCGATVTRPQARPDLTAPEVVTCHLTKDHGGRFHEGLATQVMAYTWLREEARA